MLQRERKKPIQNQTFQHKLENERIKSRIYTLIIRREIEKSNLMKTAKKLRFTIKVLHDVYIIRMHKKNILQQKCVCVCIIHCIDINRKREARMADAESF